MLCNNEIFLPGGHVPHARARFARASRARIAQRARTKRAQRELEREREREKDGWMDGVVLIRFFDTWMDLYRSLPMISAEY